MLDYMRKRVKSTFTKIVFGIIIIVFCFWGIQIARRSTGNYLVTIEKNVHVTIPEFEKELERRLRVFERIYGRRPTSEAVKLMGIKEDVLFSLINRKLLVLAGMEMGFTATPEEVRSEIESMRVFKKGGRFSPYLYRTILRANEMTPEEFEEGVAEDIIIKKLKLSIRKIIPPPTDAELYQMFRVDREKLNLLYVSFDPSSYKDRIKLTEEEERRYYEENHEKFMSPEKLKGKLIVFDKENFTDEVKVTDKDIKDYYDLHADDYYVPASYHLEIITFKSMSDARKALEKLKNGESFEKLARLYMKKGTWDMGFVREDKLPKEIASSVKKLKKGEISEILRTSEGFSIVKLVDRKPGRYRELREVKDEIKKSIKLRKAEKIAFYRAEMVFEDMASKGKRPGDILKTYGKKVNVLTVTMIKGYSIPYVGRNGKFFDKCNLLRPGSFTKPYRTGDGSYVIFYLEEKIPPKRRPFEEVRKDIERILLKKKAEQACLRDAMRFIREATKKRSISEVAKKRRLKVKETGFFFRRIGYIPDVGWSPDPSLLYSFKRKGDILEKPVKIGGRIFVFQLKDVEIPTVEDFKKGGKEFRDRITEEMRDEAFRSFLETLMNIYKVKVNWEVFKSL